LLSAPPAEGGENLEPHNKVFKVRNYSTDDAIVAMAVMCREESGISASLSISSVAISPPVALRRVKNHLAAAPM
jgi:hypothetical protein